MKLTHGLVIERQRRHLTIETSSGERIRCLSRNRGVQALVGDEVEWQRQTDGTCVVERVLDRRSTLTRSSGRGRREALAANLTRLLVVLAARPAPDWFLLDRYLLAAELMNIEALIVFNKVDLIAAPPALLNSYREIGYEVHHTSAKRRLGLDELKAAMQGHRSAMVGQSGVGKSSLINSLLGSQAQAVGSLSEKGKQGRHTTTASTLHRLSNGAELIDSPGVRGYAPFLEQPAELARGFKEFQPLLGQCRFQDCLHVAEPDCAIKQAVAAGRITARRYASYLRLREAVAELQAR